MGQATSNLVKRVVSPLRGSTGAMDQNSASWPMAVTPFVFTRRGSMYIDEDGDLAHEFYEEVREGRSRRSTMRRKYRNLIPQGEVELSIPRLHVDFPVVICEAPYR